MVHRAETWRSLTLKAVVFVQTSDSGGCRLIVTLQYRVFNADCIVV